MDSRLLTGTLDALILEVLSGHASYGYEIVQTVQDRSRGYFEITEGALYPALHRLERQKLLESFWKEIDGRERKYYKLTAAGRKMLAAKKKEWHKFVAGVQGLLGEANGLA
ncbi:MAG TPA: PadR family transcriptional regulator [Planctomycetaceae bacterium]|jgi:transcriptional regulator